MSIAFSYAITNFDFVRWQHLKTVPLPVSAIILWFLAVGGEDGDNTQMVPYW